MNKNTFLAFILILLTIILFQIYETRSSKAFKKQEDVSAQQKIQGKETTEQTAKIPSKESNAEKLPTTAIGAADTFKQSISGDTVLIENEKIICVISEVGARIISLKMKDYGYDRVKQRLSDEKEQIDLVARSSIGGGNLSVDGENFDTKLFKMQEKAKHIRIRERETASVTLCHATASGSEIKKRYTFEGNSYRIRIEILSGSLDGKSISVGWRCGITESEVYKGITGQNNSAYINEQRKIHILGGKNVEHIQQKKPEEKPDVKTGFYKWASITSKYFMVALVADTVRDADIIIEGYDSKANDDIKAEGKRGPVVDYSLSIKRTCDGNREGYWLFAGPTKLSLLRSYHMHFEKVLFGGWEWLVRADVWFPFLCEITLWLLVYINNIVKDYGVTIILLTILTRVITFPLSQSSMKSMNRMKMLQPKINHLRERYKRNAKKMNEEIMALYREEGINPLNPGCLPMFLQMPILFALFVVLQKAIELRGAHTWMIPWVKDLSQPEILIPLTKYFPNGIPMYGYGVALMPVVMAILTFFQNKMTIKDPNQKAMIYFMPVFMLVLFNNFPAGLVFYWTFSNALGILQQYILNKSMMKEAQKYQDAADKPQKKK